MFVQKGTMKQVTYEGKKVRLSSDFDRTENEAYFKTNKERKYKVRILYPGKLSFKYKGYKWLTIGENSRNIVPMRVS